MWCFYDFHKRKDHGVTMNINANNQYREMLVGMKEQDFCSVRNASPSQSRLTKRLDLSLRPFPGSAPRMLACSSSLLSYSFLGHDLQIITLCYQLASCEQHLIPPWAFEKKRDAQDHQKWRKGDRIYFPLLSSSHCQSMELWSLGQTQQRQNGASLCWASPVLGLTEPSTWLGTTQISLNQHRVNTFLWFCFCQESLHYSVGQSQPLFLH